MNLVRLPALLGAFAAALCARTSHVVSAEPGTPEAAQNGTLEIARSGNEIPLGWSLPAGEVRVMEIDRSTKTEVAAGHKRMSSARTNVRALQVQVPDQGIYWHGHKQTLRNGVIVNLNLDAFATPKAVVWTP